ncbi:MAG: hypothetical protein MJ072_06220 [Clostridia bacterium]|nr:hypothetical protein [Clostridia bacterium]
MVAKKGYESPNVSVTLQSQDVITSSGTEPVESGTNLTFENYAGTWL